MNYELDVYVDELKKFPDTKKKLKTKKGEAFFQKMDIFGNKMWYSYRDDPYEFIELSLERVTEIIESNKKDEPVAELKDYKDIQIEVRPDYANVVGQDDLTRFDNKNKKNNNQRNKRRNKNRNRKKPTNNAKK